MPDAFPRLRNEIDAAPASRDGETYYILYDRAGITSSRLLMSPLGLLIAGRLDGNSSILDISDQLAREFGGGGIPCAEIERIVTALDEALFLDGSRFQDYHAQMARNFRAAPSRPAGSAGSAYSDDAATLAEELDAMLAAAPPCEERPSTAKRPRGMIIPHIDFMRGAAGYGQAYGLLRRHPAPRAVVVVGTAHVPLRERFCLCDKDFDTPLGLIRYDAELGERLRRALAPHCDVDYDILAHLGEHSVELQAVWLRHVFGEGVAILPVLAASMGEFIDEDGEPEQALLEPAYRAMAEFLAEAVARDDVMVIASADLSHVGPRFGDEREVTNQFLAEVEEVDRAYLDAVGDGALAGLQSLAAHGDKHHVCGSACIFTVGSALPDAEVRLLGYHQAVTPEMRQAVTYASMVLA